MITEKQFDEESQKYDENIDEINLLFLAALGKTLKDVITTSKTYQISDLAILADKDVTKIEKAIKQQTSTIKSEVTTLLNDIGKSEWNTTKEIAEATGTKFIEYLDDKDILTTNAAVKKALTDSIDNLSKTSMVGMYYTPNYATPKKFLNLRDAYIRTVDLAIKAIEDGNDPYLAIRTSLKTLSTGGIQQVVYISNAGKITTKSIEAALRQNILDGMKDTAANSQNRAGALFGADAKELSVHLMSAPDHAPLQGKIFPVDEYDKMDRKGYLVGSITDIYDYTYNLPYRGIAIWNCKHYAFSYKVGVSEPKYTQEQLDEINAKNEKGIVDENGVFGKPGEQITLYNATQGLRSMERDIRNTTRYKNILTEAGDITALPQVNATLRNQRAALKTGVALLEPYGVQYDSSRLIINN